MAIPPYSNTSLSYRPDIDGLRALAVLCVVAFHAFPATLKGGFIGVDIFFVISGYLISSIIVQDLEQGKFSIVNFYNRRIRRIFPALILVLAAVMAFGWFALLPDEYKALGKHVFGGAAFVSNIVLWQEAGYFDVASQLKPLLHLWSLGIEEQFYIFFPLLLWLCAKKKFRIPTIVAALCVLSFLDNMYLRRINPTADFYSPLARVWELMVGAILSTALRHQVVQQAYLHMDAVCGRWLREGPTPNDGRNLSLVLASFGCVLIGIGLLLARQGDPYPSWKALLPVMGAACLLAAGPANAISKHIFSNRLAVFIGLISYPLYLWHWPLLSYAHIIVGELDNSTRLLRVGLVVSAFALAILTYFLVERPIRLGMRKNYRLMVKLCICMAIIASIGGVLFAKHGVPQRQGMQKYLEIDRLLVWPERVSEEGKKYFGQGWERILNLRYHDIDADNTVAVIGDSHAHSMFYGIANIGNKENYNTLLIASEAGNTGEWFKNRYNDFEFGVKKINHDNKIKKVFLSMRGMLYINKFGKNWYKSIIESIIKLIDPSKKIYIVCEVPGLPFNIKEYMTRPLAGNKEVPRIFSKDIYAQQKEYLDLIKTIDGATVIETIDLMCPKGECIVFDEHGMPTRRDSTHLSYVGSDILAERVLKPYLLE